MTRELVVLGTAAQAPTRTRNHNGYLLRWDDQGLLFDPGEGTQRQMLLAGVASSAVTRICLTHTHGDHCLGVPGVVQRMGLDGLRRSVPLHYPADGEAQVDGLLGCSAYVPVVTVDRRPVGEPGPVADGPGWTLSAAPLDHRIPAVGYRLEEPPGVRMLPDRLAAAGVAGADVGRLMRAGSLEVGGRRVRLEEVSEPRRGQVFAFVMDTRRCRGALDLARDADMLVCEATYLHRDRDLAERYAHMTARQAGRLGREAGVRRLVLTHFSQRYGDDAQPFAAEASEAFGCPHRSHADGSDGSDGSAGFGGVVAAADLQRIPLPPRRR
jgi:ribonuclease Z